MAVMRVWAFILCTRHKWHKTKEQKTMKTYQAGFPWTENKEVFCFTSSVPSTRFDWNLEFINIWTNCEFFWSGNVYIWLSVWEFKKTMPLATMSQQAHACWELKYWSPSTLLVCGHFIQIHSCMSICFSCMYTNNYVYTLLLQTISCQAWLCTITSANTLLL